MNLNVRKFPIDLYWECRNEAGKERKEIREWIIEALREAARKRAKT